MPMDRNSSSNVISFATEVPVYKLSDVVIPDAIKENLLDAITAVKHEKLIYDSWNLSSVMKKGRCIGINIYGPSGTGKSMTAEAIVNELGRNILKVNYADIESKYVGETSKNLNKLFEYATNNNSVLVFDEADALLSKRVTNMNNSTDVSVNQTRSVLLNLLDTYEGIVIFTTNFISNYDKAFLRRIPFHIKFCMPDAETRELIWNKYLQNTIPNNLNMHELAERYDDITAADICTAILNSAYYMARKGIGELNLNILDKCVDRVKNVRYENEMLKIE